MRRFVVLITAATLIVAIAELTAPAAAADVSAVLAACDKSSACGYSINDKNGDISGCSIKSQGGSGTCFYCANDGKRECIQVREVTRGKWQEIRGDVLSGLALAPDKSGGVSEKKSKVQVQDFSFVQRLDKATPKTSGQGGGTGDKSGPASMDAARNACSANPNCRVVRDDSQLAAFCVGNDCVAVRKAGKDQLEYLRVTMSDALVSGDAGRIKGKPIVTSQNIIAILIGMAQPEGASPMSKSNTPQKDKQGLATDGIKGESQDVKHKNEIERRQKALSASGKHFPKAEITFRKDATTGDNLKGRPSPPAAGLLDDRAAPIATPNKGPDTARVRSIRQDVAPIGGGTVGPMVK